MGGEGVGGISVQSNVVLYGKMGKGLYPNLSQPFLENINKGSRNDGSWKLIPISDDRHQSPSFPSAAALILENLVGMHLRQGRVGGNTRKFGSTSK